MFKYGFYYYIYNYYVNMITKSLFIFEKLTNTPIFK